MCQIPQGGVPEARSLSPRSDFVHVRDMKQCEKIDSPETISELDFNPQFMMFLFPRRLRDKLWTDPLPPSGSFEGQTVLITGATSGLGLAASMHFAQLGAKVIITSRSLSAGGVARERIEQSAGIVGQEKVQIMELDLSRYSSCVSFVDRLKQSQNGRMGIDVAVLNAGVINVDYSQSPEGWYLPLQSMFLSLSFAAYSRRLLGSKPFKSTL